MKNEIVFTPELARGVQVARPEINIVVKLSWRVRIGLWIFKLSTWLLQFGCWVGGFTFVEEIEE